MLWDQLSYNNSLNPLPPLFPQVIARTPDTSSLWDNDNSDANKYPPLIVDENIILPSEDNGNVSNYRLPKPPGDLTHRVMVTYCHTALDSDIKLYNSDGDFFGAVHGRRFFSVGPASIVAGLTMQVIAPLSKVPLFYTRSYTVDLMSTPNIAVFVASEGSEAIRNLFKTYSATLPCLPVVRTVEVPSGGGDNADTVQALRYINKTLDVMSGNITGMLGDLDHQSDWMNDVNKTIVHIDTNLSQHMLDSERQVLKPGVYPPTGSNLWPDSN